MASLFSYATNLQQITSNTLLSHIHSHRNSLFLGGLNEALQLGQLLDWTLTQSSQHITQVSCTERTNREIEGKREGGEIEGKRETER